MLVFDTIKPRSIHQQLDHRISPELVYLEKCTLKPPSQEVANAALSQLDSLTTTWEGCFLLSAFCCKTQSLGRFLSPRYARGQTENHNGARSL